MEHPVPGPMWEAIVRHRMPSGTRRIPKLGAGSVLAIAVVLTMVTAAAAMHVAGPEFEIEGNTAVDDAAKDWANVLPEPIDDGHDAILIQDPHSKIKPNVDNDWFAKGGKFDNPAGWTILKATGPAQNELTNIFADLVLTGTDGDTWMMLGMERTKTSGTFDLDFEVNQTGWNGASGTLVRTEGDVVVGFELKGNPTDPQEDLDVLVLVFDPPGGADLTGANCTTTFAQGGVDSVVPGSDACVGYGTTQYKIVFKASASIAPDFDGDTNPDLVATMNPVAFTADFTSYDSGGALRTQIPAFQFAEAAINMTALGLAPGCAGFGSVHAKSRSSLEPGSDLKDLAGPETFSVTCGISGTKYNDSNANGVINDGEPGLEGWTIKLYNDNDGNGLLSAGDTLHSTDTTDSNGGFSFSADLAFGDYLVCEVADSLASGWTQSFPTGNTICENDVVDSSLAPAGYAVTIGLGTGELLLYEDQDFANYLSADLDVTKTGTISYTASVTNNGPAAATNVMLTDDLPGDLAWSVTSEDIANACTIDGNNTLTCDVGTLADGATFSVTVTATIADEDSADRGVNCTYGLLVGNGASATTDRPDSDITNDADTANICEVAP